MPSRARASRVGVALQLRVPSRDLEAERGRLRMDAVAAPDHRRVAVLERQPMDHLDEAGQLTLDDPRSIAKDHRGRRVEHV